MNWRQRKKDKFLPYFISFATQILLVFLMQGELLSFW